MIIILVGIRNSQKTGLITNFFCDAEFARKIKEEKERNLIFFRLVVPEKRSDSVITKFSRF